MSPRNHRQHKDCLIILLGRRPEVYGHIELEAVLLRQLRYKLDAYRDIRGSISKPVCT